MVKISSYKENHRESSEVHRAIRIYLFCCCLIFSLVSCQRNISKESLQPLLENAVKDFHGQVGLYIYYPKTGMELGINMDTVFPTASMIKVPILCTLWSKIHAKQLNPDSLIHFYADSIHYPWKGEDALSRFAPGEDIFVRKLMTHMITFSDNHASLYLQDLAGTGTAINVWLAGEGFKNTRVNSRTPGREVAQREFGWGQTSPREMANLVLKIRNGEIVSPAASEAIYRHLTRIYWNAEALSQIPPYIQVASKQGAVDESKSEVALVNAPHGDYVFCIITKNQKDTSWVRNNEGYVLIRKSRHFYGSISSRTINGSHWRRRGEVFTLENTKYFHHKGTQMTNRKLSFSLLLALIFLSSVLKSQIFSKYQKNEEEHAFISSVYKSLIDTSLQYYRLYYKPIPVKFSKLLINVLKKQVSDSDIVYMREKAQVDSSFVWHEELLHNCSVLRDRRRNVRKDFGNVVLIDSTGKRLAPDLYPKPTGQNEFYYDFSVPLFNRKKDFAYIQVFEYYGKRQRYSTHAYKKKNNDWVELDLGMLSVESYQMGSNH